MSDTPKLAALFKLTPQEAVEYLQGRGQLAQTFSWQDMWQEEHASVFTVSRLANLDLLQSIQDGITRNVNGDLSRRDWTKNAQSLLEQAGWWGKKEVLDPATGEMVTTTFDPARLKLIFDTNTRMAYSAGLWQRIERNKKSHPYIRYITKRDEKVRLTHRAWDNLTLPVDHPFWKTHFPPNGWRCRCRAMSISQKEYDAGLSPNGERLNKSAPKIETRDWVNKRTGVVERVPVGIDPGFGYNPGMARAGNLAQIEAQKLVVASPALATQYRAAINIAASAFTGQRPFLFKHSPIEVTILTGKEFGYNLSKADLALAADALLRAAQNGDGFPNLDTGWVFGVNKRSRGKMGDNADQTAEESMAVAAIDQLALRALVAERHPDAAHGNPDVIAILRLYAPLAIGGKLYRVKLTVKDYKAGNKLLHALDAVEIENAPLGIFPAYSIAGAIQQGQPTTGRTITIADLLKNATLSNGEKFEP